mmetsp:Transcript_23452/g.65848  ORF Transcript_23452/g.65848 Transcript_23452/m.65848 type:complete len:367 (+) Transcript_23452:178-1278(+)|eukprot:CAMPEP_0119124870 /NCGR_PEP_ID=MMETSP1310-20130426/4346_1 /TAXON_ID=464262 /ORGANISM="Genus nov. species nov., Strain RCC2339" /LENGTH=366 /DNA_ID=CAMNT_0007114881 /DNA_START=185 /DNA_END=1285 /DNA_ORIENTATION=-
MAEAEEAVFKTSAAMPEGSEEVEGYDFNRGIDYDALLKTYKNCGFQARNLGLAIEQVNKMLRWRLSDEPIAEDEDDKWKDEEVRRNVRCKIFLGYTSNMASCGIREVIRFLAQHKLVDVIVTTAGGIEEDLIKCLAPTYIGDFSLAGRALRKEGINRIGNLLVPNDNYCKFENFMTPVLDEMLRRQTEEGEKWTPSKMIRFLGEKINDERSIYYWCYKNDIPVYSPAITDGSIGDMIYFHSIKNADDPLVLDIVHDIRGMNDEARSSFYTRQHTGMLILGGGLVKHHICNANLMKNGANYSVFINTASDFDGSDSGANPDEAISWGKIHIDARPVKLYAEISLVFPLLVAQTFAKYHHDQKGDGKD